MLDLESVMDYLSPFAKYLGGQPVSNSCPSRRMARIHRRASQLPPTGNGNVSIMAVVDDRSRENAKYPGGGGRRGRKRRGGDGPPGEERVRAWRLEKDGKVVR